MSSFVNLLHTRLERVNQTEFCGPLFLAYYRSLMVHYAAVQIAARTDDHSVGSSCIAIVRIARTPIRAFKTLLTI